MNKKKEYSIFLVDDNKMFLSSLKTSLQEKFGALIKISGYSSGEECIEHIDDNPDIVFLDYYLDSDGHTAAMNGIKALVAIKAISENIAVVMLSGQDKMEVAIDAIKNGAYDYIAKSESAPVRIQNTITNLIESISAARKSNRYFMANIVLAIVILVIVAVAFIWVSTSH